MANIVTAAGINQAGVLSSVYIGSDKTAAQAAITAACANSTIVLGYLFENDAIAATIAMRSAPPPTITSLTPNTGPANVAISVVIAGSFDPAATVLVGATSLTPSVASATSLTVTFTAASIATAGAKTVKVVNPDGKQSTGSTFTAT